MQDKQHLLMPDPWYKKVKYHDAFAVLLPCALFPVRVTHSTDCLVGIATLRPTLRVAHVYKRKASTP